MREVIWRRRCGNIGKPEGFQILKLKSVAFIENKIKLSLFKIWNAQFRYSIAVAFPGFKIELAREGNLISAQIRVNLLCDRNKIPCRVGHHADFFPAATVDFPALLTWQLNSLFPAKGIGKSRKGHTITGFPPSREWRNDGYQMVYLITRLI